MKRFLSQAMLALGVLAFAVGLVSVPILSFAATIDWAYPLGYAWLAWLVMLVATGLWLWAGIRYVIRPNVPRSGGCVRASVLVFLAMSVGHPWIFALSGRLSEIRLEHSLRPGMTAEQAAGLVRDLGGDPFAESASGLSVQFVDVSTFCTKGGLDYILVFDERQVLRSWKSERWFEGC
jgi:hypothetical protein